MPYVVNWTTLTVDGSTTDAKDIDVKLTNIADALKERLEDVLIEDATDDPWVLKDTAGGAVVGKRLLIPHTSFVPLTGNTSAVRPTDIINIDEPGEWSQASLILPPGVTITLVEFLVDMATNDTINWKLFSHNFSTTTPGTENAIASGSSVATGVHIISSGALGHVVLNNLLYQLAINVTGVNPSFLLHGARVTYNTPSSKETY